MATLLVGNGSAVLVGHDRAATGQVPASLIGCGRVGCVVGAETLSESAGVWVKTRFYRQGPLLCATVYSVAAGEPKVMELRVDTRPIARAIMRQHAALHAKESAKASVRGTTVGWGLGSLWKGAKKAAQSIGRTKLVRGVASVVKSVAKNPVAQALNPALAIMAHTTSKALGGKGVLKGALGRAVNLGTSAAMAASGSGGVAPLVSRLSTDTLGAYAAANQALAGVQAGSRLVQTAQQASSLIRQGTALAQAVQTQNQRTAGAVKTAGALMPAAAKRAIAERTKAAGKLVLSPKGKAAVATALAKAPAAARARVAATLASKLKGWAALRSRIALAKSLPPTAQSAVLAATALQVKAAPLVKQAASTAKTLADPNVQKRMLAIRAQGGKAQAALEGIARRAQTGSLDAKKSAVIVNLVARNRARIQAMSQANAGGLPGMLITRDGKLRRGRWRVQAVADQGAVLYTGPRKASERGAFQTVSGGGVLIGCCGTLPVVAGPNSPVALIGRAAARIGTTLFGEPVEVESGERIRLDSIAVAGDLPLDGVRLTGKGPAASDIGPYEVGCGDQPCAPCAAAAARG